MALQSIVKDKEVAYTGPCSPWATLGGSPTWGLGDSFHEVAARNGVVLVSKSRPETPYGTGPQVELYQVHGDGHGDDDTGAHNGSERLPSSFLRIPTYGQTLGEDPLLSEYKSMPPQLYWVLWKAGVRVILVGGTSGSTDWRESDPVAPGDFVAPHTYIPRDNMPYGLPGTELEFILGQRVAIMDTPFCPCLTQRLVEIVPELASGQLFAHIRTPESDKVVLNRWANSNGFESVAQSLILRETGRSMNMPVITGDCVSPVLARVIGAHMVYYHIVSNWATGCKRATSSADPTLSLDKMYTELIPNAAAVLECRFFQDLAKHVPSDSALDAMDCLCRSLLKERPPQYERAFSPPL